MKEILAQIKALAMKLLAIVDSFLAAITKQVSTAKGSLILLIGVLVCLDIFFGGEVGVIGFTVAQTESMLLSISSVLQAGGWQLIILALILVLLKKDKA